jgi:hypothetical protein
MTTRGKTVEGDVEAWLAGENPAEPPAFARLMDQVYAAGPTPADWQRPPRADRADRSRVHVTKLRQPGRTAGIAVTDKGGWRQLRGGRQKLPSVKKWRGEPACGQCARLPKPPRPGNSWANI